jgi:putative transcriptional regulator
MKYNGGNTTNIQNDILLEVKPKDLLKKLSLKDQIVELDVNVPQHLLELGRHVFKDCRMLDETIILQFQEKGNREEKIVINSQEMELRVGKYRFFYREDSALQCLGNRFFYKGKLYSEASFRESLIDKRIEDLMAENVWKYLNERGITRYELSKRTDIKFQTLDRYYKNLVVRYDSYILDRICAALECNISDIIEYTKD